MTTITRRTLERISQTCKKDCVTLFSYISITDKKCLKNSLQRKKSFHLAPICPCCGLQTCKDTQLKECMFFPVVGSTIRRCTKLYELSHLPWVLERTAHTGWHARFGSPHVNNPLRLFPGGSPLTSSSPTFPLPSLICSTNRGCVIQVKE